MSELMKLDFAIYDNNGYLLQFGEQVVEKS